MKKISIFLAACAVAGTASAQFSNFSSDSRFGDNWSLGVEAGVQTNLSQFHTPQGAVFGINLGKDFTPYFGMSIEALAGANNIGNWMVPSGHFHNGTAIDYLTGFVTGRWNVTNSFCGFNGGRRTFEVETNVGVGYGRFFSNDRYDKYMPFNHNAVQFKSGLNFNFNLGESKAWAISIRPAVIWNLSATGQFYNHNAVGQLTAACTYHFKTSNGTHYFVKSDVAQLQEEIAAMAALNAELQAQLANQPVIEKEVIVEKIIEKPAPAATKTVDKYVDNTFVINFAFDSAELTSEAKATLDKVPSNANATVAGYASPEGNKEYNLKLSDRRADAVKAYLEARGVKVTKTTGYGADNAESNRIVIVTLQ